MEIYLYKIEKSNNSTKRPTLSQPIDGSFKNGFNLLMPELEVKDFSFVYNGVYIPSLSRYYFIDDVTQANGLWILSCTADLLASAKDTILSMTAYVGRSSSMYDGAIADSRYPAKSVAQMITTKVSAGYNNAGTFCVGISGNTNGGATGGGTSYFLLTPGEMSTFMQTLFSSTSYNLEENAEDLFYFDPFRYVTTCRWLPFTITNDERSLVKLGFKSLNLSYAVDPIYHVIPAVTINIPSHPQAVNRGVYLNNAPYARYRLYLPGAGEIELSGNVINNDNRTLTIGGSYDSITGTIIYSISNAGVQIATVQGSIGCTIALSQVTVSGYGRVALTALNVLQSYTSQSTMTTERFDASTSETGRTSGGRSVVTTPSNPMINGVIDGAKNSLIQASISGSDGNRAATFTTPDFILYSQFSELVDEDKDNIGRPLMRKVLLSELTGYTTIINAHFDSYVFLGAEREAIERMMEGGFYIE